MNDNEIISVLPLFPLDAVVLPGEALPLHIFEPQYRALLEYCLKQKGPETSLPFGIALQKEGEISKIGCVMRIAQVLESYDDGRSLILSLGENRFELLNIIQTSPFPIAQIRIVEDRNILVDERIRDKAFASLNRLLKLGGMLIESGNDLPNAFSFQLGSLIKLDQAERQALLSLLTENERLQFLSGLMDFRHQVFMRTPFQYAKVNCDDPGCVLQ